MMNGDQLDYDNLMIWCWVKEREETSANFTGLRDAASSEDLELFVGFRDMVRLTLFFFSFFFLRKHRCCMYCGKCGELGGICR